MEHANKVHNIVLQDPMCRGISAKDNQSKIWERNRWLVEDIIMHQVMFNNSTMENFVLNFKKP